MGGPPGRYSSSAGPTTRQYGSNSGNGDTASAKNDVKFWAAT